MRRPMVSLDVPACVAPEPFSKVSSKVMKCGINWQILSEASSPMQLEKAATITVLPTRVPSAHGSRNFSYVLQNLQITCAHLQCHRHAEGYNNYSTVHHQAGWSGRTFQNSYGYSCLDLCNCQPLLSVIIPLVSHWVNR